MGIPRLRRVVGGVSLCAPPLRSWRGREDFWMGRDVNWKRMASGRVARRRRVVGRASCWVPRRVKGRRGADTCGLRGGGEGEGEVPGGFRGRDWGFEAVLGDSGGWGGVGGC